MTYMDSFIFFILKERQYFLLRVIITVIFKSLQITLKQ
jgi:hypothetical protein